MATLSVADWKKVLKAHPDAGETAPLTKALEDYGKVEGKDDPSSIVETLEKVVDRARAVKKKNPKAKDLVSHLDAMISDAEKARSRAAKLAENEEREGGEDEGEEDAESGAALRTALGRVKKMEADQARPFVLALGQLPGLVIGKRPPIARAQIKAAKEMREGKGRLLIGKCYGENGKYVFEFEDKPAGGLAKLIQKAAKEHAHVAIALKVRGGGVEIDDENDLVEFTDFGVETEESETETETGEETRTGTSTTPIDLGVNARQVAALKGEWDRASGQALDGIAKIKASVRGFEDENARQVADLLDKLADGFPGGLAGAIDALESAVNQTDADGVSRARASIRQNARACVEYLQTHNDLISACENNPFAPSLPISTGLRTSLKTILKGVG